MNEKNLPVKSLKLTAAVYATGEGVVDYVKKHGVLPKKMKSGGFPHVFGHILHSRGIDLELTEREQLVYDAILRGSPLADGMVHVIGEFEEDEEGANDKA